MTHYLGTCFMTISWGGSYILEFILIIMLSIDLVSKICGYISINIRFFFFFVDKPYAFPKYF